MASDILVGLILGGVLVAFLNPAKGVLFILLQQREQIQQLTERLHPETESENVEH